MQKLLAAAAALGIFSFYGAFPLRAEMAEYRLDRDGSRLTFHSRSTLHAVHGKAKDFQSTAVHYDHATATVAMEPRIDVTVSSMETGVNPRDQAMFRMFETEKYPALSWKLEKMTCRAEDSKRSCEAFGALTIRSQTHPFTISLDITPQDGGLKVDGRTQISLKAYELKPPSVFKIIRVFDEVTVEFDTLWKKSA